MNRKSLTKIAAPMTAAILLVSTMTFGIAANAQTTPTTTPPVTQSVTQAATQQTTQSTAPTNPRGFGIRLGLNIRQVVLQAVEQATGLTQQQITQAFGQGQNLMQILTTHNGDPAAIKTSVLATLSATIAQDVKDGKLTQTQADQLTTRLSTAIDQALTRVPPAGGTPSQNIGQALSMRDLIAETAKATKLTARTIVTDLQGGQTLAQIATANKGDVTAIVAAAVTDITTRVNQQVTAGRLTQAQADQLLTNLSANLTTLMNTQNPPPAIGGRFGNRSQTPNSAGTAQAPDNLATPSATQPAASGTSQSPSAQGAPRSTGLISGFEAISLITQTAKATSLTPQAVAADLQNGQTLAQIATANKADVNTIVTAAVGQITTRINQQVTAGRLTQAQADQQLANLSTTLTTLMNTPNPLPFGGRLGNGNGFGNGQFGGRGGSGNGQPAPTTTPNAPSV